MTDTERLDAMIAHNISIVNHGTPQEDDYTWWCHYNDHIMHGPDLRKLIDSAVLDIVTEGQVPH
jgi:hypothetical protein